MDRRIAYRKLLRIVRRYGVSEKRDRGKGSHRLWERVLPEGRLATAVKCHSEGQELSAHVVASIRRRLGLNPGHPHGVSDEEFYAP